MSLDRKGTSGSGTRRVRFQSPEDLLLQERLDAAQAIPGTLETRARLRALHQQDKAERQLQQQQDAERAATAAVASQPEPKLRTDRQLKGLFAYNIEELYTDGKLDYAALKSRLQSHTPGQRSTQPSAGIVLPSPVYSDCASPENKAEQQTHTETPE